jgi:hypothetical protein
VLPRHEHAIALPGSTATYCPPRCTARRARTGTKAVQAR